MPIKITENLNGMHKYSVHDARKFEQVNNKTHFVAIP